MRITGRFKGYFLSVHMANLSASHRMKVVSSVVVRSVEFAPKIFETNELEYDVPCHREANPATRSSQQWLPCSLHAVTHK